MTAPTPPVPPEEAPTPVQPEAAAASAGSQGRPWAPVVTAAVVAALVGGAAGAGVAVLLQQKTTSTVSTASTSVCDTVSLAKSALPAVVTIFASSSSSSGSGSGAIIRSDGLILTNDHVIDTALPSGKIEVLLNSGVQVAAKLIGTDPLTDLAVLKIDKSQLPTLTIAPQEPVQVGQPVVALGAPLGLSGTVTSGIISALDRNIPVPTGSGGTTVLAGALQTDASINPGNSGGPLVTCDGLLIGVNTAISTVPNATGVAGGGSVGIGFAVPASTARRITDQLVANGKATHPWIGAQTAEISQSTADRFGTKPGLFVQEITKNGPAAKAGLAKGDVITTINGSTATGISLAWLLVSANIGETVKIGYFRNGSAAETTLTLAEQP